MSCNINQLQENNSECKIDKIHWQINVDSQVRFSIEIENYLN